MNLADEPPESREKIIARWEAILMTPGTHPTAKRMAREALQYFRVREREPGEEG